MHVFLCVVKGRSDIPTAVSTIELARDSFRKTFQGQDLRFDVWGGDAGEFVYVENTRIGEIIKTRVYDCVVPV